jgi:magnesium-transporting ATPase (P-type)
MISGVCAAVSLAVEAPNISILKSERVKENFRIVTPYMIREIATQVIYQILVMCILLYLGPLIFGF